MVLRGGEVGDIAEVGGAGGRTWGGYSRVVVVGESSTSEAVEKYAEVGVTIDGGVSKPPSPSLWTTSLSPSFSESSPTMTVVV